MKRWSHLLVLIPFLMIPTITPAQESATPTPESVIGWAPCADYKLATYEQIAEYFHVLDKATDRMQLVDIGETAEGRTQLMAIISSESNMQNLSRYKEISQQLARARVSGDEAQALVDEGKAIVWIDFGLHSTEVAHGQTAPWMAYKAVTEETEEMQVIRDNVIFLLVPNMNPDGTTLVAEWYMQHVGTQYEGAPLPELYQKYVGHDNNRDWFMFNQPESQNIGRQVYHEWFPQIIYNQHQSGPFPSRIFIPPFAEPVNPNIPPLVMRGINAIGSAMGRRFDQEGKTGVVSRVGFDTWWNGGMRTAPYFHNMVGILTETSHTSPAPTVYDPATFPATFGNGESTTAPSAFYPNPYMGGEWHLRDSCEYMLTGSMAVLDIGAKRRAEWLSNIYQMGREAIADGEDETYVISADQWDPGTAAKLVNVLRWGAIDVEQANAPFTLDGVSYPAGSYVIPGAQPFRSHLTDLLTPQVYPDRRMYPGGPPDRPYDVSGWTLPYQMGVSVQKHSGLGERSAQLALEQVERASPPNGSVSGLATVAYAIDPKANDAFTAVNRLLTAGESISRTTSAENIGTRLWPPGTFLVVAGDDTHARVEDVARSLGLRIAALTEAPLAETTPLRQPRVGLYHAWGGNMDEGWTRWVLEQFEFTYDRLHDAEVRLGNLRANYDVILLPDASYTGMLHGLSTDRMPPEYSGGMTIRGLANLYDFVVEGGTLVAMDSATELPLAIFDLPLREVTSGQSDADFFIPGTLLHLNVDHGHPLGYGMPEETTAFFSRSPAFALGRPVNPRVRRVSGAPEPPSSVRAVATYPIEGLLKSGWLLGEHVLSGRAAVVEADVEAGRVVLLGFRTQHRGQPHATFKLLFNALYRGGM